MKKKNIDIEKARIFFKENEFWRRTADPAVIVIPQLDYLNAFLYYLETNRNVIPEWEKITVFMFCVSRCSKDKIVNIGSEIQFYSTKDLVILRKFINGESFWDLEDFCNRYNLDVEFCKEYFEDLEWELQAQYRKTKRLSDKSKINQVKKNESVRQHERRKAEVGFIYVISDGEKYKIGKTTNLNNRFQQLCTSNPNELKILLSKEITNYHFVESLLLKKYSNKRISGEWFILDKQDIIDIKVILDAYDK